GTGCRVARREGGARKSLSLRELRSGSREAGVVERDRGGHGPATVSGEQAPEVATIRADADGKAGRERRSTESGDLFRTRASNPFVEEGVKSMVWFIRLLLLLVMLLPAGMLAARGQPRALDPVVLTATKLETRADQLGTSVTVVPGGDEQKSQF